MVCLTNIRFVTQTKQNQKCVLCLLEHDSSVDVTDKLSAKVIGWMIPDDHLWRWLNTLRYWWRLRPLAHCMRSKKEKGASFWPDLVKCWKAFIHLSPTLFPRELLPWKRERKKEGTISTAAVRISMVQPTPHTLFYCIFYPSSGSRATRHGRLSTRARRVCSIFFSLFGYKSRVDLLLDCLFGFVSYPIRFGKLKNISLFFFGLCYRVWSCCTKMKQTL